MLNDSQQDCFAGDCTYIHTNKHIWAYRLRYTTRHIFGGPKNTDAGNVFQFMKLEELTVGEDSKPEEKCSELAGTHFTIGKIKFQ
jgi:hypothetical protein